MNSTAQTMMTGLIEAALKTATDNGALRLEINRLRLASKDSGGNVEDLRAQLAVNERNNNLLAIEISTLRLTIKTLETQLALSKTKKALKKARGPRP